MPDGKPRIRRYEPRDNEAVRWLHEFALRKAGAYIEEEGWYEEDMDDIESFYLQTEGEFLVGTIEDEVVAMGALKRTEEGRAEIKRMRVAPDFQGRGFGKEMLAALEKRAAELGYATLHLDTAVQQKVARNLYAANGYREARRGMMGGFECIFYEKSGVA